MSRPHTPAPPPADESVVAGGVRAIAIRQITPWCAGAHHPEDAVEDTSIVHTRHASRLVHRPDGRPFVVREFVAHDSRPPVWELESRLCRRTQRRAVLPMLPPYRTWPGHGQIDAFGRVEMWRGCCRPNISVAAPFV